MYVQLLRASKTNIIRVLKEAFQESSVYTWSPNDQESKIFIGDVYAYGIALQGVEQPVKYLPAIFVEGSSSNAFHLNPTQLQEDIIDPETDFVIGQLWAGAWDGTYSVTVAAESVPEREELADIVATTIMYAKREDLFERGILVKTVNLGSEGQEPYGNNFIYTLSLSVSTYGEWWEFVPYPDLPRVQRIDISSAGLASAGLDTTTTIVNTPPQTYSITDSPYPGIQTLVPDPNGTIAIVPSNAVPYPWAGMQPVLPSTGGTFILLPDTGNNYPTPPTTAYVAVPSSTVPPGTTAVTSPIQAIPQTLWNPTPASVQAQTDDCISFFDGEALITRSTGRGGVAVCIGFGAFPGPEKILRKYRISGNNRG